MDRRRPRHPPTRPLVLLVEEYEDTCTMYACALSDLGFEVVAVEEGGDAFRRAWEIHPDIIVADLPMPSQHGWPFLDGLKQSPRTRDIPIVAISSSVHRTVEERLAHDGLAAFFPKPCLPQELAQGLRRVLDGHAHVDARR